MSLLNLGIVLKEIVRGISLMAIKYYRRIKASIMKLCKKETVDQEIQTMPEIKPSPRQKKRRVNQVQIYNQSDVSESSEQSRNNTNNQIDLNNVFYSNEISPIKIED